MMGVKRKRNRKRNRGGGGGQNRRDPDVIRTSEPGGVIVRETDARIPDYMTISDDVVKIGKRLSGGQIEIDLPTGDYTYRGLIFQIAAADDVALTAATAVAAADLLTTGDDDQTYVEAQYWSRLIKRAKLVIDGEMIMDFESFAELRAYIKMNSWDLGTAASGILFGFGWPHVFRDDTAVSELYALGTSNLRDVKITIYTTDEWDDDMDLRVTAIYHPVQSPAKHIISREVFRQTLTSVGSHVIDDIRISKRIWRIVITTPTGDGISNYKVSIGDRDWQESTSEVNKLTQMLLQQSHGEQLSVGAYRGNTGALDGVGSCIDLVVDTARDGLALQPLTSDAQRRRDDRIEIELTTLEEDTEVRIEVYYSDRI